MSEWAIMNYIQAVVTAYQIGSVFVVFVYLFGLYIGYIIGKSENNG